MLLDAPPRVQRRVRNNAERSAVIWVGFGPQRLRRGTTLPIMDELVLQSAVSLIGHSLFALLSKASISTPAGLPTVPAGPALSAASWPPTGECVDEEEH